MSKESEREELKHDFVKWLKSDACLVVIRDASHTSDLVIRQLKERQRIDPFILLQPFTI